MGLGRYIEKLWGKSLRSHYINLCKEVLAMTWNNSQRAISVMILAGVCKGANRPNSLGFSGLKKTRPFQISTSDKCSFGLVYGQFLPLFWRSFTCQLLAVNARNRAKTTRIKTLWKPPVILIHRVATWTACYRIEKRGNLENGWGGCWEECCENSGRWRECWRGCCSLFLPKETPLRSTLASTLSSTPNFSQHSSQHPPQPFSRFPRFSILYRPFGSQS